MNRIQMLTVPSVTRIFADRERLNPETEGSAFRNEVYKFQIAVLSAEEDLSGLTLSFGGALKPYLTYCPVADIPATLDNNERLDDYVERAKDGMYPELCAEEKEFSLSAGKLRGVLVIVQGELPAGRHKITVFLQKGKELLAKTSYMLTVIDRELPETDLMITNWMHYDSIAEQHGVAVFSEEFYRIFDRYLRAYVGMGNNMLLIPTVTPALDTEIGSERLTAQLVKISKDGDTYAFDFSELDRFLAFITERGIRYFEFAHLFSQWGAKCCPKIMVSQNGEEKNLFGWNVASDSAEYRAFLTQYLTALTDHIYENGWQDRSVMHLSDEPNEDSIDLYEAHYKFVKPLIRGIRTMDALSHVDFSLRGVVDLPVPITVTAPDFVSRDIPHLAYYCCGPENGYYSNRFFVMPGERTRVIGVQLYKNRAGGFLQWGYNFYRTQLSRATVDPYAETSAGGAFLSGDAFIVYPDRERGGVEKSFRYYLMQDAFQDYRALKLLEEVAGRQTAENLLSDFGVFGYNVYPHSPLLLRALREAINRAVADNI
ncbi:MAG: DUF4091 domain-containing protein [Clostridia bacterium]|nr:DUF4091 domain-containing protein [Clostridia bacterium]